MKHSLVAVGLIVLMSCFGSSILYCQDQLRALPDMSFHLTATPWTPEEYSTAKILQTVEEVCRVVASFQDERGAIVDPYLKREHQYSTPYFAFAVGVLIDADLATDLLPAGIAAMEHSTKCFGEGWKGIPDQHGEFFIMPLTESLQFYQGHVSESTWNRWTDRMKTPLDSVMKDQQGRLNNWRTYAMKGEWSRANAGLVERQTAIDFIEKAWQEQTQRERIALDQWNLYQDWSSDPQSLAVEAVGRVNLAALLHMRYDGPSADEMWDCVRRGTATTLLLQAPDGQAPPNGRTDNHVFNDVLYQLGFELMVVDGQRQGNQRRTAQYRRAAALSFRSIHRWRQDDAPWTGSFSVTKNHMDPKDRVGYQPASQWANYNGAVMLHLAETALVRGRETEQQPAPTEVGGFTLETDERFSTFVANAGGHQVLANLRGATVPKYGQSWTPLGVVRFGRVNWDGRLGPSDGVHQPAQSQDSNNLTSTSDQGMTFAPVWKERGKWIRMADVPQHYQADVTVTFSHPLLVRFQLNYHHVTGRGGPYFRHEFTVTPDGTLAQLVPLQGGESGVTVPILVNDGQPLRHDSGSMIVSTKYADDASQQSFIAVGGEIFQSGGERMLSSYGWLEPQRLHRSNESLRIFVYPHRSEDPSAAAVKDSFRVAKDGFSSVLASVAGTLYRGRTSAGGEGDRIDLDDQGSNQVAFDKTCRFVLQLQQGKLIAAEADRPVVMQYGGKGYSMQPFQPIRIE